MSVLPSPESRRRISGIIVSLFCLLLAGCGISESGAEAFGKAQEALKQTTSWRYTYQIRQLDADTHEERKVEVVCPGRMHMTGQFTYTSGRLPSSSYEFFSLDGIAYQQDNTTRRWFQRKDDRMGPQAVCASLAEGTEAFPFPDFGKLSESGRIEKGAEKTYGGERCQEWRVKFRGGPLAGQDEELCLGLQDHLPRHRISFYGEMTYTDWNDPFVILPPD